VGLAVLLPAASRLCSPLAGMKANALAGCGETRVSEGTVAESEPREEHDAEVDLAQPAQARDSCVALLRQTTTSVSLHVQRALR
jgi:hypothetical protein